MRRASFLLPSLVVLALMAGCDKASTPGATAPPTASTPTPTPAPAPPRAQPAPSPATDDGPARAAALAKGPGTCEEDVAALRVLPQKGQLGRDPHFDRMAVHPRAYTACLVALVRDRTPLQDPGEEPKRTPYDLGNLAYDLLQRLGHVEAGECIPPSVMQKVDTAGAQVVTEWLDDKNHRRQAHRCLAKRLGQ